LEAIKVYGWQRNGYEEELDRLAMEIEEASELSEVKEGIRRWMERVQKSKIFVKFVKLKALQGVHLTKRLSGEEKIEETKDSLEESKEQSFLTDEQNKKAMEELQMILKTFSEKSIKLL
jgi:uncharacterized ferredoxin-like protein